MILTAILISLSACAGTKVVTPEIPYKSHAVLKQAQPNCLDEINAMEEAFISGSGLEKENACLNTVKCYRSIGRYWENSYRVIDAELKTMQGHGDF